MKARFFDSLPEDKVRCTLCHQLCVLTEGQAGLCGVRQNLRGRLETQVYDRLIAEHVDPIEKKPIFHMLPGSLAYSVATVGCNFKCRFCQNYEIAHMPQRFPASGVQGHKTTPQKIVQAALAADCQSIAYTYTEPTVFFELMYDTARLAHLKGIRNVMVTNGYIGREALESLAPFLDAANVDLKSFSDEFYQRYVGGRLKPVLNTIAAMRQADVLVEVTTLVIPGLNDQPSELTDLARYLSQRTGPETPWHVSRFHPTYQMTDRSPTPVQTLLDARQIGLDAGLRYVYVGNVPGIQGEDTACPQCGKTLVQRHGFRVITESIENGQCCHCGHSLKNDIILN